MGLNTCPVATVAAPIEDVWELLAWPSKYDNWWDAHTKRILPEGPAVAGQSIDAWSTSFGKRWPVNFVIKMVNPDKHEIQFDAILPLGISVDEHIKCTPIDVATCRVQFG